MDISLFEVDPSWAAVGVWTDEIVLSQTMADLGFSDDTEMAVRGWHVPRGGERALKIGATTGLPAALSMASKRRFMSRVMSSRILRPLGM